MPKYVMAEKMPAPGCFQLQAVEGYRKIVLFCEDGGTSIISHRCKSEDACGCRIHFQVD
ncbi:hypothetical protein D3C80_1513710 [compost metagenome]